MRAVFPAPKDGVSSARRLEHFAKAQALDFTTVVMRDTGHDFPPKYMTLAGRWIRGEKPPPSETE